jgi:hypothetical protein
MEFLFTKNNLSRTWSLSGMVRDLQKLGADNQSELPTTS